MSELRHSVGFIYVLTNDSIPGTVKIGVTGWLPEDRAKDLWTTGVPEPFKVAYRMVSSRDRAVERKAHELLNEFRPNKKREFFTVSVDEAIESVRLAAVEVAGIASWKAAQPYRLRAGDRLALTLESGQCFALLAYRNIFGSAEILDIWQAHSDGDSLEIFCHCCPVR
jgi:hypothetical protein